MVGHREGVRHQHPRTVGSGVSNKNINKTPQTILNSHENRQHFSTVLHSEDGGHQKPSYARHIQKDLALSSITQDHDYCRMDPISPEHNSRLGVEKCLRLSGVEALPQGVPINLSSEGSARFRSVRIKDLSSGQSLLQLESGSGLLGSGRFSTELEPGVPLRISPFLPHNKSAEKSSHTNGAKHDSDNSSLAISTMVPTSSNHVYSTSTALTKHKHTAKKPIRQTASLTPRVISPTSGLASIRDRLVQQGISEEAQELILSSRSKGTITNYESAWKEWRLWCSGGGVDTFACPIRDVVNYLGHMFKMGYEYKTINVHRSALSAYHDPVRSAGSLMTVGKHPQVSSLMSGVQNLRPPRPKYAFTWDIEAVLCLFRSWPLDLTPKQLTIKVTTLLALIGVPRGAELHLFDLDYFAKFGTYYSFGIAGNTKTGEEGVIPDPVEFDKHLEDEKLCPISCIDQYIKYSAPWRPGGQPSYFFLSHRTHKPVTKPTLARWIKQALFMAEVDTKVFQAHSLRGASTSAAILKGLSVKEVVSHGRWSLESTWQKYYHKPVVRPSKKFQDSILKL